eukprot:COSAG02_NODE_4822_length_4938_cov_3.900393_1_plen_100_part_10
MPHPLQRWLLSHPQLLDGIEARNQIVNVLYLLILGSLDLHAGVTAVPVPKARWDAADRRVVIQVTERSSRMARLSWQIDHALLIRLWRVFWRGPLILFNI